MADLESRIERELIAAAGRSGRLRYARSPLPRPAALATVVAAAALVMGAITAGISLVNETPTPRPAIDERPVATPTPQESEPRRTLRSPRPAPVELASSYSALADGKIHQGPRIRGRQGQAKGRDATVTIHGTSTGGCIAVMYDGDLGPGGMCFTERNVKAQTQWLTNGGILFVLVPDAATDISIETTKGIRRSTTATSNLVVARPSDTVRYSVGDDTTTVTTKAKSS